MNGYSGKMSMFALALVFWSTDAALSASPPVRLVHAAAKIIIEERPEYGFGKSGGASGKYDCSGFLQAAVSRANLPAIPRDSRSQYEFLSRYGRVWLSGARGWESLRPGDLIFFSGTYPHTEKNPISHVMIYAGREQMIGAQSKGVGLFSFRPSPPEGGRAKHHASARRGAKVYAYVRPDWGRVLSSEMGTRNHTARTRTMSSGNHRRLTP